MASNANARRLCPARNSATICVRRHVADAERRAERQPQLEPKRSFFCPPLGDRLEHRPNPPVLLHGDIHRRVLSKQLVDRIGRRRAEAYDGIEPTANRCCLRHRERSRGGRRNSLRTHVMAAPTQGGSNERVEGGDTTLP